MFLCVCHFVSHCTSMRFMFCMLAISICEMFSYSLPFYDFNFAYGFSFVCKMSLPCFVCLALVML